MSIEFKKIKKNILIACDSFKDGLPALEVCQSIEKGLKRSHHSFATFLCPLADGGEGSLSVFLYHSDGEEKTAAVLDPKGRPITANWGISRDKKTAFIEMAQASGLELLSPAERDPFKTNTFGTGQLILEAIQAGVERVVLSIGGSATHDGGTAMAQALGYRFFDQNDQELVQFPEQILEIDHIQTPKEASFLQNIQFLVLCDVENPLTGPRGAAYTYALQKGARKDDLPTLDNRMVHLSNIWKKNLGLDLSYLKGGGAAGGMGAGSKAFLNASLKSGIQYMLQLTNLNEKMANVDYILTGEGKIDHQTLHGKVIKGVIHQAQANNIPVIGLCGKLEPAVVKPLGLKAAFSISTGPSTLEEALKNTAQNLELVAEQIGNLL